MGIMISAVIGGIISFIIFFFSGGFVGSLIVGTLIGIAFFSLGFPEKEIPKANVGVISRFGERIFNKVTTEGYIWLFPFIYKQTAVSVVEITITIGDVKPLEVLAIKPGTTDRVPLEVKILVRVYIWNAPVSIGFEYKSVEKNIVEYVNSTLRQIGAVKSVVDFVEDKKGVADAVLKDFMETKHEAVAGQQLTYNEQVEAMGYRIKDIELVKVDLPEELKKASTAKEVEEAQRTSETVEIQTLITLTDLVKKAYPSLSDEEALNRVQAERKKLSLQVIKGSEKVVAVTGTNNETIGGSI